MALQSLIQNISPSLIQQLRRNGYCVVDNALPHLMATNLLSEMRPLQELGILYPCHSHFKQNSKTTLIPKQNVWELELHSYPELQPIFKDLNSLLQDKSLCELLNEADPSISSSSSSSLRYSHQTLKVLYSENNGCFPFHFDSDPEIDSRRITAILYLNEHEIENGELMLFPLMECPMKITPKWNRLVMFSSCFMLHRTLPSMNPRYALNFWIHTEGDQGDFCSHSMDQNEFEMALNHKYLKCTAKCLYEEDWTQSMLESHGDSADTQWMIQSHRKDVGICRKVMSAAGMTNVIKQIDDMQSLARDERFFSGESWFNISVDWLC